MKYNDINGEGLVTAYPTPGVFFNPDIREEKIDEYVALYNKYNKMFIQYILSKTNLRELDRQIDQQKNIIKPLDRSQMDIYQYCVSDELKYLYIRNNMHIGRLSETEKEFLKNVKLHDGDLTPIEMAYIEKTFSKVIAEGEGKGKEQVNFGNSNVAFLALDNSIVIGLRYCSIDPWNLQQVLQADGFCESIVKYQISATKGTNLGVPIVGHLYSPYSVNVMYKKRENKGERS